MANMKIGVIIQGSLEDDEFDRRENCNSLIESFLNCTHVDKIVISCWEEEDTSRISKHAIILKNQKIIGKDNRNRIKQFRSILEGVKFLENNTEVTHVLKIRTDQTVPIDIINEIVEKYSTTRNDTTVFEQPVTFCYVNRSIPFHIGDFYFAGSIADIQRFAENILSYGTINYQGAVEIDVVLKHLAIVDERHMKLISFYNLHKQMCIPGLYDREHPVWRYWLLIYKGNIQTFSKKILAETTWRGRKYVERLAERRIYGDVDTTFKIFNNLLDFDPETNLLRKDEPNYLRLPLDTRRQKIRHLRDIVDFLLNGLLFKTWELKRKNSQKFIRIGARLRVIVKKMYRKIF